MSDGGALQPHAGDEDFDVRPARSSDMSAIHAIQKYYVAETLANFSYEPATLGEMRQQYDEVVVGGYPYLVAVHANPSGSAVSNVEPVLGYAFVHPFRTRAAYQYTGELSIFCHPRYMDQGVGGALLEAVIAGLRKMKGVAECIHSKEDPASCPPLPKPSGISPMDHASAGKDWLRTVEQGKERDIHQLIACMTVDPDYEQAERLRRFYARHGFVEMGLLRKVAWKWDQWLDIRYMQLEL
ncbi:MAG: hypothetical protein Q9165_004817 [Trypethelium subeluteriae]